MRTRGGRTGCWAAAVGVAAAALAVLAGGCAATPATAEQRRLAEQRLLAPFLRPVEVGCGELTIELTGNFHGNVGQPGSDPARHRVERSERDDVVETVWTNLLGDPSAAFVVTIGEPGEFTDQGFERGRQTRFTVVQQVRLRVFQDRRPLTLSATASGSVVLVKEAGQPAREVASYAVADGATSER